MCFGRIPNPRVAVGTDAPYDPPRAADDDDDDDDAPPPRPVQNHNPIAQQSKQPESSGNGDGDVGDDWDPDADLVKYETGQKEVQPPGPPINNNTGPATSKAGVAKGKERETGAEIVGDLALDLALAILIPFPLFLFRSKRR